MVKNLSYYEKEGRLQLLEVLSTLVDKFPRELLDKYAEMFFFTLMLRSINDQNSQCREKVAVVIKRMLKNISQSKAMTLLNTVLQMDS